MAKRAKQFKTSITRQEEALEKAKQDHEAALVKTKEIKKKEAEKRRIALKKQKLASVTTDEDPKEDNKPNKEQIESDDEQIESDDEQIESDDKQIESDDEQIENQKSNLKSNYYKLRAYAKKSHPFPPP